MANATVSLPRRRYYEFDLLRSISLLLMVTLHVLQSFHYYMEPAVVQKLHWLYYTYPIIGPSALMISMGTNLAFARSQTPGVLAKRGLIFILLDLGLNTARYVLPGLVYAAAGWNGYLSYAVSALLRSEIYAFVGAFFLLFALFKRWKLSSFAILNIAILMMGFNALVEHYQWFAVENTYLSDLLSRLFWVGTNSYFPLFSWAIFPAIGYFFGECFHRLATADQHKLARRTLAICSALIIALLTFLANMDRSFSIAVLPLNDFKTEPFGAVLMILLTGVVWSLLHLFVNGFPNAPVMKPLQSLSKRIVSFYLIQWVLIIWLYNLLPAVLEALHKTYAFHSTLSVVLLILLIILLTNTLSRLVSKHKPAARAKAQA